MGYLLLLILGLLLAAPIYSIILKLIERRYFKEGRNPYERICKKCGCHQELHEGYVYEWNCIWWEDVPPFGDNPNCECHICTHKLRW
jgi:hypothetical protein